MSKQRSLPVATDGFRFVTEAFPFQSSNWENELSLMLEQIRNSIPNPGVEVRVLELEILVVAGALMKPEEAYDGINEALLKQFMCTWARKCIEVQGGMGSAPVFVQMRGRLVPPRDESP